MTLSLPTVHGVIARRLLVNFRVDPQALRMQNVDHEWRAHRQPRAGLS